MHPFGIAMIGVAAAGGGVGAFYLYQFWGADNPSCVPGDLAELLGDFEVQHTITNDGGPTHIRLCAFNDSGRKVIDEYVEIPVGTNLTRVYRLPVDEYRFLVDIEGSIIGHHPDLRTCAHPPARMESSYMMWQTREDDGNVSGGGRVGLGGAELCEPKRDEPAEAGFAPQRPITPGGGARDAVPPLSTVLSVLVGSVGIVWAGLRWHGTVTFAVAAGFSRLLGPRLLDQRVRMQFHQVVNADPGIHAKEIGRRLELGNGSLAHPLGVMIREGVLERASGPVRRNYFLARSFTEQQKRRRVALRDARAADVYRAILSAPGQTLSSIAGAAACSKPQATNLVKRLEGAGVVRRVRDGPFVRAFPAG